MENTVVVLRKKLQPYWKSKEILIHPIALHQITLFISFIESMRPSNNVISLLFIGCLLSQVFQLPIELQI